MSVERQLLEAARAFCRDRGRELDEMPDATIMIPLTPTGVLGVPVIGLAAAPDAAPLVPRDPSQT